MNRSPIISLDDYELCDEPIGRVVYFEATIEDIVQVSCATRLTQRSLRRLYALLTYYFLRMRSLRKRTPTSWLWQNK